MCKNSDDFMTYFAEMFLEKMIKDEILNDKKMREQAEEKMAKNFDKSSSSLETFKKIIFAYLSKVEEDACIMAELSYALLESFKRYTIGETGNKASKREFNALTGLAKTEIIKGIEKMFEDLKFSIDEVIEGEEDER